MRSRLFPLRARRGVGFLFFVLVGLPCVLLALVISFDATRVYLAAKEARAAASAAADAGAYQFQTNTVVLDQRAASVEAAATIREAQRLGVTKHLRSVRSEVATTSTSVSVSVTFNVTGLSPVGALVSGAVFGGDLTVVATSDVCQPGRHSYTNGRCSRPEE